MGENLVMVVDIVVDKGSMIDEESALWARERGRGSRGMGVVVEEGSVVVKEGGMTRENEIMIKNAAAKKGCLNEKGKGLVLFARHVIDI